jgi:hypothetical protein
MTDDKRPDLTKRYQIADSIAHREIEGQILLIRPDDQFLYTLNGSGKRIWQELQKEQRLGEIVATLARHYNIDQQTAAADVVAFMGDLLAKQIVAAIHE